jgi:hypothetical protein
MLGIFKLCDISEAGSTFVIRYRMERKSAQFPVRERTVLDYWGE